MNQNLQKTWNNDDELFHIIRTELYTAVIGDIMDVLGYMNQFCLHNYDRLQKVILL